MRPQLAILAVLAATGCSRSDGFAQRSDSGRPVAAVDEQSQTGATLYRRCAQCHQPNGEGVLGQYPPLAGSRYAASQSVVVPIAITLRGLTGLVVVKGVPYHSTMDAYRTGTAMSNDEVAAVLTYVRSSWGNKAPAITPTMVAIVRETMKDKTGPVTSVELAELERALVTVSRSRP